MRNVLLVLTGLLLAAGSLSAQSGAVPLAAVPMESRVRITDDDGLRMTGRLLSADSGQIVIQPGGMAAPAPFSVAALRSMRVSRGRRRGVWTAAGALAGVAAGIVYTRAQPDDPGDIGGLGRSADGIGNTVLGAVVGGAAGFLFAPERWRSVNLGR